MKCPNCKQSNPNEYIYCLSCGAVVDISEEPTLVNQKELPTVILPRGAARPAQNGWRFLWLIPFILFIGALVAGWLNFLDNRQGVSAVTNSDTYDTRQSEKTPQPVNRKKTPRVTQTRVVGRFIFYGASASRPIENEMVRVWDGNFMYEEIITKKGWYVEDLPCDRELKFTYGETLKFSESVFVPCQSEPLNIGLYSWNYGGKESNDTDNVDGCYACK
jgi:hypothetical protein